MSCKHKVPDRSAARQLSAWKYFQAAHAAYMEAIGEEALTAAMLEAEFAWREYQEAVGEW